MIRRGISSLTVGAVSEVRESLDQEVTLDLIRHSLDVEDKTKELKIEETSLAGETRKLQDMDGVNLLTRGYWTDGRAGEAEEYLKDVVYGGVEGFAYIRSLAEFVTDPPRQEVYLLLSVLFTLT